MEPWNKGDRKFTVICGGCGKTIRSSYFKRFCGIHCYRSSDDYKKTSKRGGRKPGPVKPFIERSGYRYLFRPKHPFSTRQGYIAEHRVKMEEKIGRYLTKSEVVHHINHLRHDNRIENLQLMRKRAHQKLHMKERAEEVIPRNRDVVADLSKGYRRKDIAATYSVSIAYVSQIARRYRKKYALCSRCKLSQGKLKSIKVASGRSNRNEKIVDLCAFCFGHFILFCEGKKLKL